MKLIDQIINVCGTQIPMRELNLMGSIANATRLKKIEAMEDPEEFERLYHEEQSITSGEYFWLWVRYIRQKIIERDTIIDEGFRDEVLPLDEFVRSLNAPPAILCEVFFRGDFCQQEEQKEQYGHDEEYEGEWDSYSYGLAEIANEFYSSQGSTFNECTFEDYLRWFTSGVMQFVRTIWEYEQFDPWAPVLDYRFLVVYEKRIPEICQTMIDAVKEGKLPPERISFGFLNPDDTFWEQIQNEKRFQELPDRILKLGTDQGPLDEKPWGDFCSIWPSRGLAQNLPKDAALSDLCANCAFPCGNYMVPVLRCHKWDDYFFSWAEAPDLVKDNKFNHPQICNSWKTGDWSGWFRCENFAYVKMYYIWAKIQSCKELITYRGEIDDYDDDLTDWEDLYAEEEDRLYYPEYYHPGNHYGRRHHGGGGKGHKIKKTELEFPDLEKRVHEAFKKWDKSLEPLVQTVTFLTNHGMNAQGRDLSTWQNAANWLFEVKEKQLFEVTANLETSQIIKLTQLCGRLPWQKMRDLLNGPIHQCKGECVTTFRELIRGTQEPLSESAENMIQNELYAQVYRLAEGWSKIC